MIFSSKAKIAKHLGLILIFAGILALPPSIFSERTDGTPSGDSTHPLEVITLESGSRNFITHSVEYYLDTENTKTIENIREKPIDWKKNDRYILDFGYLESPLWIRLALKNNSREGKFFLTLSYNRLNYVDFYLFQNGILQKSSMGSARIMDDDRLTTYPYLPIPFQNGETVEVYILIQTDTHVGLPMEIMGELEFGKFISHRELSQNIFLIITIIYIFYQMVFNSYLDFRLKVLLALSLVSGYFYPYFLLNEGFRVLLGEYPAYRMMGLYASVNLFGLFFTLYLKDFLKFYKWEDKFNLTGYIIAFIFIILLPVLFFPILNSWKSNLYILALFLMYSYMFFGIFLNLYHKRYWVCIFGSGWLVVYVFLILQYLMYNRIIPFHTFLHGAFHVGFTLEFILIGFASYYRYKAIRNERTNLHQKLNLLEEEIQKSSPKDKSTNYEKRTKSLDIHQTMKVIIEILERDKPFLDEKYTIQDLAGSIGLRPDQVSAVINQDLQTSFWNLITEYRIGEAKKMIDKDPKMNLLRVAFDSGFGSRSAFNRAFQALEGMSPGEYAKKKIQPESLA